MIQQAVLQAGSQSALARSIGASQQEVWNWLNGLRRVPLERCPAIERATHGATLCESLRPDVCWARIPDPTWPHPAGRPVIDVARPVVAQEAA